MVKYTPLLLVLAFVGIAINNILAQTSAGGNTKKYKLVWSDEFNYEGLPDSSKWKFESGFVRNNELQWYQPENARCHNGILVIEVRK
jgi:beta-glucanase (GH16 family)